MKVSGITTGLLAAFLLGNVTVKNVPSNHTSNANEKTSISQLVNIASDNLTAKVAIAGEHNYGERDYVNARAMWRDGDTYNAIDTMELVVDANPLVQKYSKTLIGFYTETGLYGEMEKFFTQFVEDKKELLNNKKNSQELKYFSNSFYEAGIDLIYNVVPSQYVDKDIKPSEKDYAPGIKLLELAVELEPNNPEYHYELGWGYDVVANSFSKNKKEFREIFYKGTVEQIKSIDLGGAEFVKSKRQRGFISERFSDTIPIYEKAAKLDPEFKFWGEELNIIKEYIKTNF